MLIFNNIIYTEFCEAKHGKKTGEIINFVGKTDESLSE